MAYRKYFSTDQLMFQVQAQDERLDNKDEVVVMLFDDPAGGSRHPVALSVDFLEDHPVFQAEAGGRPFVVVTSPDGANRVYHTSGQRFERRFDDFRVVDAEGRVWRVTEDELVAVDDAVALRRSSQCAHVRGCVSRGCAREAALSRAVTVADGVIAGRG